MAEGKGVITSHDAGVLWNNPQYSGSGHAVLVTGVEYDANGQLKTVIKRDKRDSKITEDEYKKCEEDHKSKNEELKMNEEDLKRRKRTVGLGLLQCQLRLRRGRSAILKRLLLLSWILILITGYCAEAQMTTEESFKVRKGPIWTTLGWNEWDTVDPFTFIELLKKRPETILYLGDTPKNWVKKEHLEALVALLDSTEPASATCYLASAHLPSKGFHSTVGQEAARILQCYRRDWTYPGNCSDLSRVDVQEIKSWWTSKQKK